MGVDRPASTPDPSPEGHQATARLAGLDLLRKTGPLVLGRALQVGFGLSTTLVTTRALGPERFGEVATTLALAGVVGAIVGNALSDSGVLGVGPTRVGTYRFALLIFAASLVLGIAAAGAGYASLAFGVVAFGVHLGSTIGTAPRLVSARAGGRAIRLAVTSALGSVVALCAVVGLSASGVASWGPFALGSALPATLLWTLPVAATETQPGAEEAPSAWGALPFAITQASWSVLGNAPIFVLRGLVGARAAGEYGALARLIDLAAVVRPLVATFALPAFHRLARGGAAARATTELLNLWVAAAALAAVAFVAPLSWLYWDVAYPGAELPRIVLAVLVLGTACSAASGIPNRILEAAGRAAFVSRVGVVTAVSAVVMALALAGPFGLLGVVSVRACAACSSAVVLLGAVRPRASVLFGHVSLAAVSVLVAGATLWIAAARTPVATVLLAVSLPLASAGVAGTIGLWFKARGG